MSEERDGPESGEVDWLAPFSPVILRAELPAERLHAFLAPAEALVADTERSRVLEEPSPVLRNTTQRVRVPAEFLYGDGDVGGFLEGLCERYLQRVAPIVSPEVPVEGVRATVEAAWVNRQLAGDFIPLHRHDGNLSGVVFLKVPDLGSEEEEAGRLQFFDGRPIDPHFVRHKLTVDPVAGHIYVFPSWLHHTVYAFRGPGERWSMSFNAVMYETSSPA